MQHFKSLFKDESYKNTFANVQSCFRTTDLEEISDGNHLLNFDMIGFFSFREWTIPQTIDLFMEFMKELGIPVHYITIHPDKFQEWKHYYDKYNVEIRIDEECIWSDGEIGGYCTEFYSHGVEIGNIVNTLGSNIDVGFGKNRLQSILSNSPKLTNIEVLEKAITCLIDSGIDPSNKRHGYVLRKIIRKYYRLGGKSFNLIVDKEFNSMRQLELKYKRLKEKYKDRSSEWWWDTHGIKIEEFND